MVLHANGLPLDRVHMKGVVMSWREARSLVTLLGEVNTAAPNRSKISDGSIGDPAHSSRLSDHNPNPAGVVRARDFTHDPADGCDAGTLAEAVRKLGIKGHPALGPGAYVIWNRRIASATYGWAWRTYTGSNPHDHHCHVSVATAASGYDSTAPWGVMEDDMALSTEDKEFIRNAIRTEAKAAVDALLDEQQANGRSLRENIRAGGNAKDIAKAIADEMNVAASKAQRKP